MILYSDDSGLSWDSFLGEYDAFFRVYKCTDTIISCYAGDPDTGGSLIGTDVFSTPISSTTPKTASFTWDASASATDIYVTVDRPGIIAESNESNNKAYKNIVPIATIPTISSISPAENAASVTPADRISVVFNEAMSSTAAASCISARAVKDIAGNAISEATAGTVAYSTPTYTLTYTVQWKKGYTYEVTVSTGAQDLYGNAIAAAKTWTFKVMSMPAITASSPAENSSGVSPTAPVTVEFWSDDMDSATVKNSISVALVKDNNSSTANTAVTGTVDYTNKTLTFTATWQKGCTYLVTISTMAKDLFGNAIASPKSWKFTTIMDKSAQNTLIDEDTATKVVIPSGAMDEDYYVLMDTAPLDTSASLAVKVANANTKIGKTKGRFTSMLNHTVRQMTLYRSGAAYSGNFLRNADVTIPYAEASNGMAQDSNGRLVKEKTLAVYYLDEAKDLWVKIPNSTVDTDNNTVTAGIAHFSVFAILGGNDTDISNSYAYPVPWKPFDSSTANGTLAGGITFTGLGSEAKIRIYTLTGELVRVLNYAYAGGAEEMNWDGTNSDNELCASGVYIYYIENDKEHKTGKLVIIK
ncbi:MAG: Ig-like domain-containing protein [Endomicrobiales bacterium]|nr:Ig-like domain-containing protein [Endomicrobiales bacterium]